MSSSGAEDAPILALVSERTAVETTISDREGLKRLKAVGRDASGNIAVGPHTMKTIANQLVQMKTPMVPSAPLLSNVVKRGTGEIDQVQYNIMHEAFIPLSPPFLERSDDR